MGYPTQARYGLVVPARLSDPSGRPSWRNLGGHIVVATPATQGALGRAMPFSCNRVEEPGVFFPESDSRWQTVLKYGNDRL